MALSGITEQLGRVLGGRYRLTAPIGTGSSAQVFLADDVQLRRRVAVKVLHPVLATDEAFLRRFRAEARAAAALSHPNLMAVYDWGEDDGPYLVLELLGGGSLRAMLDAGSRLDLAQAAAVGLDAARALDAAHRRGFVHRDIKPANLLFGDDGRLRIADFGLARALSEAAWTEPGDGLVGTARYAAPEQASSPRVDGKADVYALGLVLIEAVTGHVPLTADTALGTLMCRVDVPVPVPAALGPLRPLLEEAGSPDPAARPAAGTLEQLLLEVARSLDPPAPFALAGAVAAAGPSIDPTLLPASPEPSDAAWSPPPRVTARPERGGGTDGDVTTLSTFATREPTAASGTEGDAPAEASAGGPAGPTPGPRVVVFDDLAPRTSDVGPAAPPAPTSRRARRRGAAGAATGGSTPTGLGEVADERPGRLRSLRRRGPAAPGTATTARAGRRGWRRALLAVVLLLLLGAGGWAGVTAYRDAQPTRTAVPAVTTLERDVAEAELAAAEAAVEDGLDWPLVVTEEHSEVVLRGFVIDQDPEPGTVLEDGEEVRLVVSLGPPPRAVPDLFNRTLEEARTDVAAAELVVGRTDEQHVEDVGAGRVITWSVAGDDRPDEVPKGSEVDLIVSSGPAPRQVPSLTDVPAAQATAQLEALGLVPVVVEDFSNDVDAGQVVGTVPDAGASVARGTSVEVTVSRGPDLVRVPDLSGSTESEAIAALRANGLVAGDANGPAGGEVFASEPRAGASVVRGTTVDLFRR